MTKVNEEKTNIFTELKELVDNVGTLQTAWGLVVAVVLVIVFVFCVLTFNKRVNNVTKAQIKRFQQDGKYIPSVYIELNNSMEYLRYFLFSYKWKYRVIRQFNHLFRGYEGKRLKRLLGPVTEYRLSRSTSISELNDTLSVMHEKLDGLRKDRRELFDKHGEVLWAVSNSTYNHVYAIEHMQDLCAMMQQKNVILVGSAGNGKTNLLCRAAEVAVANRIPCLLINSRDIKEDCVEHITKKILPVLKLQTMLPLYLRLISLPLFLQRKYFYIFIDAINENDKEVFINSVSPLLKTFSKYTRIRILMSCRSEYFDSRYKTLFASSEEQPYIYNLHETAYSERAITKMIRAYMDYFNVRGPFSIEMQEKLQNSLFLTRIFFEINSNLDECMLEFRNAEIYKLYFEKITAENKGVDLRAVIKRIAEYMFAEFQFDKVPMEELRLSPSELDSLRNLLDNNLIISRTVRIGSGITERQKEDIYFVFDELRDFCLARYLLSLDEDRDSKEYETFFANATKLFGKRLSPIEGVLKYAYHHFKMGNRADLCEKILKMYGESDVQSILEREKRGLHKQRTFSNFGFSLIFAEGDNVASFETDYILHCIKTDCWNYWEIFWFLLGNEYSGFKPNIRLAVDILQRCSDDCSENILSLFFKDNADRYYSYSDKERRVDVLKSWLDAIEEKSGELSQNLKIIVAVLAAYDPAEFALRKYHKFIKTEEFFNQIQESALCDYIKTLVNELKERMDATAAAPDAFQTLLEVLRSEGYYE